MVEDNLVIRPSYFLDPLSCIVNLEEFQTLQSSGINSWPKSEKTFHFEDFEFCSLLVPDVSKSF